jgi:hypothetical protein
MSLLRLQEALERTIDGCIHRTGMYGTATEAEANAKSALTIREILNGATFIDALVTVESYWVAASKSALGSNWQPHLTVADAPPFVRRQIFEVQARETMSRAIEHVFHTFIDTANQLDLLKLPVHLKESEHFVASQLISQWDFHIHQKWRDALSLEACLSASLNAIEALTKPDSELMFNKYTYADRSFAIAGDILVEANPFNHPDFGFMFRIPPFSQEELQVAKQQVAHAVKNFQR